MINFKIPVNRHLFAGQLKTECLQETSSASAALWYDYHQTRKKKKKNDFHSLEKWVTLTLQIGVTSHAHAYTWNQIAVKSSHWGQSTALEAHIQRAFTVHACTAIHRDTNYNEQIWSGVGSCPSKWAHHTKKHTRISNWNERSPLHTLEGPGGDMYCEWNAMLMINSVPHLQTSQLTGRVHANLRTMLSLIRLIFLLNIRFRRKVGSFS